MFVCLDIKWLEDMFCFACLFLPVFHLFLLWQCFSFNSFFCSCPTCPTKDSSYYKTKNKYTTTKERTHENTEFSHTNAVSDRGICHMLYVLLEMTKA